MSNLKITVEGTVSHIEINVVVKNTINKKESLKTLHLTNFTLDQWNELIRSDENVKQPWPFCETPAENCTMNYCDENGCQNRKRCLVDNSIEGKETNS